MLGVKSIPITRRHFIRQVVLPTLDRDTFMERRCNQYNNNKDDDDDARKKFFSSESKENKNVKGKRVLPNDGVTLSHFIHKSKHTNNHNGRIIKSSKDYDDDDESLAIGPSPCAVSIDEEHVHYYNDDDDDDQYTVTLSEDQLKNQFHHKQPEQQQLLKFHMKTYGCQMNVNDSDIVRSILLGHTNTSGHALFQETQEEMDADILLTNTCAIRENAEQKVWNRLRELRAHDRKNPRGTLPRKKRIVGVLGCMAERLKEDMFKDGTADVIVGPDAYRDLPSLLSSLADDTSIDSRAVSVQLSLEETYADVTPVRSAGDVSAFVSVMRGCNNMCSYCVVPFTRGRERSRELTSIVQECQTLYYDNNVKEIVLLGQNVNSYHDKDKQTKLQMSSSDNRHGYQTSNDGFTNMFRLRGGQGHRFADLVEAVSDISPELRVRFTSPHPKDYPPELLTLMAERPNVCNQLHMPAQSGSTSVLERMRRGYSREAYLQLIDDVKSTIPDVALTSDFISGFCGETDEEHQDTLSLMEYVKYDQAFMFAYSMRGKTHASRSMEDDVPEEIKKRRLSEVIATFRHNVQEKNEEMELGKLRLVLVEGMATKKKKELLWHGRTDQNKRILFPPTKGLDGVKCWTEEALNPILSTLLLGRRDMAMNTTDLMFQLANSPKVMLQPGDYAVVQVTEVRGHTLKGKALWRGTIQGFNEMGLSNAGINDTSIMSNIPLFQLA